MLDSHLSVPEFFFCLITSSPVRLLIHYQVFNKVIFICVFCILLCVSVLCTCISVHHNTTINKRLKTRVLAMKSAFIHKAYSLRVSAIRGHHEGFKNIKIVVNMRNWTVFTMDALLLLVPSSTAYCLRYDIVNYIDLNTYCR
jgi:hypothetical protein